jgi:hypothetical protein
MTRRIKWAGDEDVYDSDSDDDGAVAGGGAMAVDGQYGNNGEAGAAPKLSKKGNFCDLVWVGTAARSKYCDDHDPSLFIVVAHDD